MGEAVRDVHSQLGARKPSTTGAEELVRSLISVDDSKQGTARGNVKVLALTAFLFGLITAVQWGFGAWVNSRALIADCKNMLIDALTYFLNMWTELAPPKLRAKLRLAVPCISLTVLAVLNGLTLQDAVDYFTGASDDDSNTKVSHTTMSIVVLSFGLCGMLFDLISIYAFWRNKKQGALPVNMLAAFMHVGADLVRSTTTTIEGVLVMIWSGWDAELIDAINTIVIVIVIFGGVIYGLSEAVSDIRVYVRESHNGKEALVLDA